MKYLVIPILGCISLQTKINQIFNDDAKVVERNYVKTRNGIKQKKTGTLREHESLDLSWISLFQF